jgi:hypothetical protein
MLTQPVNDEQHGLCLSLGKSSLLVEVDTPHPFEVAGNMIHKIFFQIFVEMADGGVLLLITP